MQDIQALKAKHAAEVARLERELQIAKQMPLAPDSVLLGAKDDRAPWVTYRKRTFAQALEIFRAFQILPAYVHKGAFTEIQPEGMARPDSHVAQGPFALWLNVDCAADGQFGPSAKLHFFATVNGNPYRVNVDLEGPGYIGVCHAFRPSAVEERDGRRRLVRRSYRANATLNGLADHVIGWSYGAGGLIASGARHSYLICADDDAVMSGGEHGHACGQLANIADAAGEGRTNV